MMRVFLLIGSRAKTPHPCSFDRLRAILGSLPGFAMRRASYTGTTREITGRTGGPRAGGSRAAHFGPAKKTLVPAVAAVYHLQNRLRRLSLHRTRGSKRMSQNAGLN